MDVGDTPYNVDRANALGAYSLAYDWIQPPLIQQTIPSSGINWPRWLTQYIKISMIMEPTGITYHLLITMVRHIPWLALQVRRFPIIPTRTTSRCPPHRQTGTRWGRNIFSIMTNSIPTGVRCSVLDLMKSSGKHLNGAYKSYVIEQFRTLVPGFGIMRTVRTFWKNIRQQKRQLPLKSGSHYQTSTAVTMSPMETRDGFITRPL